VSDADAGRSELWGYLVEFENEEQLVAAAERVREAGYTRWDVHAPFALHGLDGAMGIRATRLPYVVFAAGLTGTVTGLVLQWFTNAFDYPWVISGKPIFSLPANIPVMFELTILFAAFGALLGMLGFNRLPELYHPLHAVSRFRRVTDDRFFISVEAKDPEFDPRRTRELLDSLNGRQVEEVMA
jgi:hypothetical protein